RAIRTVAGHAGRDAAAGIAFAVQLLAGAGELGVGHAGQALLLREVSADVVHVLRRERRGHALHDRVLSRSALEAHQLGGDVLLALARELGILRIAGIAVHAVAGAARGGLGLTGGGIARLGRDG